MSFSTTPQKISLGSEKLKISSGQEIRRCRSRAVLGAIVADLRATGIVPSGKKRNLQAILGIRAPGR
jgi:hypothetical protein